MIIIFIYDHNLRVELILFSLHTLNNEFFADELSLFQVYTSYHVKTTKVEILM